MASYEGVFIVDPDVSNETYKSVLALIQDLITKNGGRIDGLQEWGKKRLAYRIKKKADGSYIIVNFELSGAGVKKAEQSLKLNDQIIRYMIINKAKA